MRLAMALLVVWSHCFAIYFGDEGSEPISVLLNGRYNAGNIAVRVFFVISGLLIARSFELSGSVGSYFRKRISRIYPGFLVAVTICSFIVVPLFSSWWRVSAFEFVKWAALNLALQGAMLPSNAFAGNPISAINGALWSISFEFWCYIGVAVAGVLGMLRRRWLMLGALVAFMVGKAWLDATGRKPGGGLIEAVFGWPYLWFSMAPCFLAGILGHQHADRIPRSRVAAVALLLATIAAAHLCGSSRVIFDLVFVPGLAYVVFFVAFSPLSFSDLGARGDFSYGTYLYGFPIQQMIKSSLVIPFVVYVPLCTLLALLAGVLSWFVVERHFTHPKSQRSVPHKAGTCRHLRDGAAS